VLAGTNRTTTHDHYATHLFEDGVVGSLSLSPAGRPVSGSAAVSTRGDAAAVPLLSVVPWFAAAAAAVPGRVVVSDPARSAAVPRPTGAGGSTTRAASAAAAPLAGWWWLPGVLPTRMRTKGWSSSVFMDTSSTRSEQSCPLWLVLAPVVVARERVVDDDDDAAAGCWFCCRAFRPNRVFDFPFDSCFDNNLGTGRDPAIPVPLLFFFAATNDFELSARREIPYPKATIRLGPLLLLLLLLRGGESLPRRTPPPPLPPWLLAPAVAAMPRLSAAAARCPVPFAVVVIDAGTASSRCSTTRPPTRRTIGFSS